MHITRRCIFAAAMLALFSGPRAMGGDGAADVAKDDQGVMGVVASDLTDPGNPVFQDMGYDRKRSEVAINSYTILAKDSNDEEVFDLDLGLSAEVLRELRSSFRSRNDGVQVPTSYFKLNNKYLKNFDFYEMQDRATHKGVKFEDIFWSSFPDSRGYVIPYLPVYKKDGTGSIVVLKGGPSAHSATWVYYLEKDGKQWKLAWRFFHVWE